jgi:hypothetical protein
VKERKKMPETMNEEWKLSKLRDELEDLRERIIAGLANGESVEVMEACLALGESMARQNKPAISHIEQTIPMGDR